MVDSEVTDQWACTVPFESYIKVENVEVKMQSEEFESDHHQSINNETDVKFKLYKPIEINEEFGSKQEQLVNDEINRKLEPYRHDTNAIKSEEFESEQQQQLINNEIDITFETYRQVPNEIFMKIENIEFKVEDSEQESFESARHSKKENESSAAAFEATQDVWTCGLCDFISISKYDLRRHITATHKDPSNSNLFKCNRCDYKSKHMHKVTWHDTYHKSHTESHRRAPDPIAATPKQETPPEKPPRKCCLCDFTYTNQRDLAEHIHSKHKDPSNTKMFKCNVCEFVTEYFHQLMLHTANHGKPTTLRHCCDKCPYQTMQKTSLVRHVAKHGTSKEYTCDSCPFKTLTMKLLKRHVLTHESTSATPWHQCQVCEYRTMSRYQMTLHVHRHLWKDL